MRWRDWEVVAGASFREIRGKCRSQGGAWLGSSGSHSSALRAWENWECTRQATCVFQVHLIIADFMGATLPLGSPQGGIWPQHSQAWAHPQALLHTAGPSPGLLLAFDLPPILNDLDTFLLGPGRQLLFSLSSRASWDGLFSKARKLLNTKSG